MEVAYLTTYDHNDIRQWSGSGYFIGQAIKRQFDNFTAIGSLSKPLNVISKVKEMVYPTLIKKRWDQEREVSVVKAFAHQAERKLQMSKADFIFSPGTTPIAFLKTNKPIFFWTDAVFAGMLGYYPEYCNLHPQIIQAGNTVDQEALSRCRLAFFASNWAAKTAVDNYSIPQSKVKVVPFGANIENNLSYDQIMDIIAARSRTSCKLLFVGVDWVRKGGNIALQVAKELVSQGLRVELHIVGVKPLGVGKLPDYVVNHGFINKADKTGRMKLEKLFAESHFLLVPSREECYGLVFCEASSFGLPSLSTKTGGIPTIIKDGLNGMTFNLNAEISDYCSFIADNFINWSRYKVLAIDSYNEYCARLNWQVAGKKIKDAILQSL